MSPPNAYGGAARYAPGQSPYGAPASSGLIPYTGQPMRSYAEDEMMSARDRQQLSMSNAGADGTNGHNQAAGPSGPQGWARQPSPPSNVQMTALAAEQQHAIMSHGTRDREKMLAGFEFSHSAPELQDDRERCRAACWRFNQAANPTLGLSYQERMRMFLDILAPHRSFHTTKLPARGGIAGQNCVVEAPFTAEYGFNLQIGTDVFIGPGCTIMDGMTVVIGQRTYLGPNVQIYSTSRPTQPERRQGYKGSSVARSVTIGDDCYIAGGVIIRSGAHIGRGSTIEVGSVVEGVCSEPHISPSPYDQMLILVQ